MDLNTVHTCGRRANPFSPGHGAEKLDTWLEDGSCSYCGSLNGDEFMARLRAGDVELGPTDKSYKVYVNNKGGAAFKQTYRTDDDRTGDRTKWVWVTREIEHTKFYFQHLSPLQQTEFVELYNEGQIKLGFPGYFYTLPYFCTAEAKISPDNG